MNTEIELNQCTVRARFLLDILQYQSDHLPGFLKAHERWQIHYERGSLFRRIESFKIEEPEPLRYKISEELERKINIIHKSINN